jgi:hypothetical protein
MRVDRNLIPHTSQYLEAQGMVLVGKGPWVTTACEFHVGSDSMRVNVESGGWVCMSCFVKGGDAISYVMQRDGVDFVTAVKGLGAWVEDGRPAPTKPRSFSDADVRAVLSQDLHLCAVVLSDALRGVLPTDGDWRAFQHAAGTCIAVSEPAR